MKDSERLDELRRKLENPPEDSDYYVHWDEDVRFLLAEIERLQQMLAHQAKPEEER